MSEDILLKATVTGFEKFECIALVDGEVISIDPFVTNIWEWEEREKLFGTWLFKGHWYGECFLPEEIYHPIEHDQKQRIEELQKALETIASIKYDNLGYSPEDAQCMNDIAHQALKGVPNDHTNPINRTTAHDGT